MKTFGKHSTKPARLRTLISEQDHPVDAVLTYQRCGAGVSMDNGRS